jgi:hypothetical protein
MAIQPENMSSKMKSFPVEIFPAGHQRQWRSSTAIGFVDG